jgi:hypothetical protein
MKRGPPDSVGGCGFSPRRGRGGNKRDPPDSVGGWGMGGLGGSPGGVGNKRDPPDSVGGLGMGGAGCPITANWEALSVAIDNIEPTDVTFRRNLVIFFIF